MVLTGEERVRNGGSENEDSSEDDTSEITRVGGERRDGNEETGSGKTNGTNSEGDSGSALLKAGMSARLVMITRHRIRSTHDSLLHVPLPKLNGLSLVAFEADLSPLLGASDQSHGTPCQRVYVLEQEVRGGRESKSEGNGKGRGSSVLEDIDQRRGRSGGVVRHVASRLGVQWLQDIVLVACLFREGLRAVDVAVRAICCVFSYHWTSVLYEYSRPPGVAFRSLFGSMTTVTTSISQI